MDLDQLISSGPFHMTGLYSGTECPTHPSLDKHWLRGATRWGCGESRGSRSQTTQAQQAQKGPTPVFRRSWEAFKDFLAKGMTSTTSFKKKKKEHSGCNVEDRLGTRLKRRSKLADEVTAP